DGALVPLGDRRWVFSSGIGFAVSAPGAVSDDGRIYVFDQWLAGTMALGDATAILKGSANERAGTALAAGDVNGDMQPDLVVGAPAPGGSGRVYVVPG